MADHRVVVLEGRDHGSAYENNPASDDLDGGGGGDDGGSTEVMISPKGSYSSTTDEAAISSTDLPHVSTFDSSSAEEESGRIRFQIDPEAGIFHRRSSFGAAAGAIGRRFSLNTQRRTEVLDRLSEALKEASHHDDHFDFSLFGSWEDLVSQVFYISMFSVFGAVLRVYIARLFGLDCELEEAGKGYGDFFTSLSSKICVTSDGKGPTQGAALFVDLPANMLGSFFMGMISPVEDGHPLPWFRQDHRLQRHKLFHVGLKVGLCGCLTTFASWNTQMVLMLDGTDTVLGPQIASALFGYVLGIACATSSFIFGRHVYDWWRNIHPPPDNDNTVQQMEDIAEVDSTYSRADSQISVRLKEGCKLASKLYKIKYGPLLFVAALIGAFAAGDAVEGLLFYRRMWMTCLLAPFGAVLRWRISVLNKRNLRWTGSLMWLPWGTLIANILAAVISLAAEALHSRSLDPDDSGYEWASPALIAIEVGFAGSLSTVSTMVREMFSLETSKQSYTYGLITIVISMLLGLLVYSPIIRAG